MGTRMIDPNVNNPISVTCLCDIIEGEQHLTSEMGKREKAPGQKLLTLRKMREVEKLQAAGVDMNHLSAQEADRLLGNED